MSRVGNKPIFIPDGVDVKTKDNLFEVKGKLGELSCIIPPTIIYKIEDGVISFSRPSNKPQDRANHGLSRALVNNLVEGVTKGFSKTLELEGTGYKWEVRGDKMILTAGFSHAVEIDIPKDITIEITGMRCVVSGIDKHQVGFIAAQIFRKKPVEPYKGKGIRYQGQYVRRKAGKSGA